MPALCGMASAVSWALARRSLPATHLKAELLVLWVFCGDSPPVSLAIRSPGQPRLYVHERALRGPAVTRNGGLPYETRDYVIRITGRSAEDWREELKTGPRAPEDDEPRQSCLQLTASLRSPSRAPAAMAEGPLAPWGVQLAGNFSKSVALASFGRARQAYASILGEGRPMIIGTRMRSRGLRPFYRVRVPVSTREAANALCNRLRSAGGSCIVLPT